MAEIANQPGPNAYAQPDYFAKNIAEGKGKSIGIPYSMMEKMANPASKGRQSLEESRNIPGPGAYSMTSRLQKKGPFISIGRKGKNLNYSDAPDVMYKANYRLVERSRYQNISMGYGKKSDFTK